MKCLKALGATAIVFGAAFGLFVLFAHYPEAALALFFSGSVGLVFVGFLALFQE